MGPSFQTPRKVKSVDNETSWKAKCNMRNTQLYLYVSLHLCLYLWLHVHDVYVYTDVGLGKGAQVRPQEVFLSTVGRPEECQALKIMSVTRHGRGVR